MATGWIIRGYIPLPRPSTSSRMHRNCSKLARRPRRSGMHLRFNRQRQRQRISQRTHMKIYTVEWTINIEAESAREAAEEALQIMRDPASIALVFHVTPPEGTTEV